MSQKQMIDFTASRPTATADFSLRQYESCAYDKEKKCWLINAQGSMRFNLDLISRRGINLILKLAALQSDRAPCKIDITINGKTYVEKWNLNNGQSDGYTSHAWHIPHLMLQAGNNDIAFKLHNSALLSLAGVHMFVQQDQQQQFWCWSAVTTSISKFYDPGSSLTQCKLANSIFKRDDCCQDDKAGKANPCNKMCLMQDALTKVGYFDCKQRGAADIGAIVKQSSEGKPIAAIFSFFGSGHVLSVTGAGVNKKTTQVMVDNKMTDIDEYQYDMIAVYDPWYGHSYIKYEEFKKNYRYVGTWHSSCFTNEGVTHEN